MKLSTQPAPWTLQDLRHIVNRASTLYERLAAQPDAGRCEEAAWRAEPEDPAEARRITKRLERWCQAAAGGDWQRFERRLGWDGHNLQTIRPYLGSRFQFPADPLPAWALTLDACIRVGAEGSGERGSDAYPFLQPEDPIPFEELFAPFVVWARQQLRLRAGSRSALLSAQAHSSLERGLLELLGMHAALALHLEFSIFRARADPPFRRLADRGDPRPQTQLYRRFIDSMQDGTIVQFYKEYAVLGRETASLVEFWIEMLAEFLDRLAADREDIAARFNQGLDIGEVTEIQMGVSDRHHAGRSVLILRFASGLKLVYKPGDLTVAAGFSEVLAWLNQQADLCDLKELAVLDRAGYGWLAFIDYTPCADTSAAARFFRRMGMLTCLVYALGGNDFHYENLIAAGEYPVLIDLETLFQPHALSEEERLGQASASIVASKQLWSSVMRTGILPRWSVRGGHAIYDTSGLGGFDQQETALKAARWTQINTDHMTVEPIPDRIKAEANLPMSGGKVLNPDAYLEEFVDGFTRVYTFLSERRDELLAPAGPLAGFREQRVRFLVRSTYIYAALQQKANQPDYLREGIEQSLVFEALARRFIVNTTKPLAWPALKAEHQALAQLDIPLFTTCTSSTSLESGADMTIPDFFEEPGYARAVAVIKNLSQDDLTKQLAYIRAAFYARVASLPRQPEGAETDLPRPGEQAALPLTREALVQEALSIAAELREQACHGNDGSATWIAIQYDPQIERFQLQPLGTSLYSGTSGIGLFLAALEKVTGGAGYRDLALGTMHQVRRSLHKDLLSVTRMPLGGMVGIGAMIYALVRMSDFLGDHSLLDDARLAASTVTPERIAAEQAADIIQGCSGAALALLALYHRTGDEASLQHATEFGKRLVQLRVASPAGLLTWQSLRGRCLTGFSHGAAGISYALLKLYEVTGEQAFLDAAQAGLDYERGVFVTEAGNWPDFREETPPGAPVFMTSWCHGAPGIGLGRLGAWSVMNTPQIHSEIEVALATTRRYGPQGVDQLCCGSAGRMDLLLEASRRLERPELAAQAQQWMGQIVASARQKKAYQLFHDLPASVFHPGLFQGTAGIGYEMLRLAEGGETLPSVLLLD
ncbi:MAG TPA: type 2 lanthipeptide synthetase LanM family protein [Ktedonobacterales bacterium]|nr:type 2 lanthipeptide synthetase LanM family protein [Ktedonobacterales bacterium]